MKVSRINNSLPKSSFKDYSKEIKAALVKKASTKRGFNIEKKPKSIRHNIPYTEDKIKEAVQQSRMGCSQWIKKCTQSIPDCCPKKQV